MLTRGANACPVSSQLVANCLTCPQSFHLNKMGYLCLSLDYYEDNQGKVHKILIQTSETAQQVKIVVAKSEDPSSMP